MGSPRERHIGDAKVAADLLTQQIEESDCGRLSSAELTFGRLPFPIQAIEY